MWKGYLGASVACLLLMVLLSFALNQICRGRERKFPLFQFLFAGVFLSAVILFLPVNSGDDGVGFRTVLLSVFNAMQIFTIGGEFSNVSQSVAGLPENMAAGVELWAAVLFVLAPIFTFGFVLSLFKNLSANIRYWTTYFRDVYIFSELNEKSLVLAEDIKTNHKKAAIVFTDVFEDNEESSFELVEEAKKLGAICFRRDVAVIRFKNHAPKKALYFFTIGEDENENLNQSLKLIARYRDRANTHLYVFCTQIQGELLLTSVDKGQIKVRRINAVQSLINRILYEQGQQLFQTARPMKDGSKHISAVVVGLGNHGVEMLKALAWFGQMDGYTLQIDAFDSDPLAEEKFTALAPELMSEKYNGVTVAGEAQYSITIHSAVDVQTASFADAVEKLKNASYVFVALGDDGMNIHTAVRLRMYFARMNLSPVIQAVVYNAQQKNALTDIKNYRGQPYDIQFVGDTRSSYTEAVILDSEVEEEALKSHLKWGQEEEFWTYEYNYRSSTASAIHRKLRIKCGVAGAGKKPEELTLEERDAIEVLEHRRWNAYMRAEGYVFSGSKDPASRNDLAKMHNDLVVFDQLDEEEKRKDSRVGSE